MPVPTRHKFSARLVPSRRQKPFVRAAYASGAGEDPYKILELPRSADSTAILRAYRNKLREAKGNENATARIENAHSQIMMSSLSTRLQGKSDVGKEILYADRAKIFPWRPRVYPANRKLLMYSAIAQALFLAYGVFNPSLTLPIVYGAMGGAVGQLLKQNEINPPPPPGAEAGAGGGMKNVLRGFFLAFLATSLGCLFTFTIPDGIASATGRVLPFWFYQNQNTLLTLGTTVLNFLSVAFFR